MLMSHSRHGKRSEPQFTRKTSQYCPCPGGEAVAVFQFDIHMGLKHGFLDL
jgi:hypothetical protein